MSRTGQLSRQQDHAAREIRDSMWTRERWGQDIETAVQSIWLQLDCLSLANSAEVKPHRKGLIEIREKVNAILDAQSMAGSV